MTRSAAIRSALAGATSALFVLCLAVPAAEAGGAASAHAAAHRTHHGHSARRRRRHHHRSSGPSITGGRTLSSGRTVIAPHVPSGPCPNADLEPTSANLALINQATMCLVNKQRVAHGVTPLAENAQLDAAAQHHNSDMIASDYFDHVSPTGSTPLDRIKAVGYIVTGAGYEIGENIATGSSGLDTPSSIVNDWMNSAGHRANILNPDYTETGVAAAAAMPPSVGGGLSGGTYTQDFGVIN